MANRYQTVSTVANHYVVKRYCGESLVIREMSGVYNVEVQFKYAFLIFKVYMVKNG